MLRNSFYFTLSCRSGAMQCTEVIMLLNINGWVHKLYTPICIQTAKSNYYNLFELTFIQVKMPALFHDKVGYTKVSQIIQLWLLKQTYLLLYYLKYILLWYYLTRPLTCFRSNMLAQHCLSQQENYAPEISPFPQDIWGCVESPRPGSTSWVTLQLITAVTMNRSSHAIHSTGYCWYKWRYCFFTWLFWNYSMLDYSVQSFIPVLC